VCSTQRRRRRALDKVVGAAAGRPRSHPRALCCRVAGPAPRDGQRPRLLTAAAARFRALGVAAALLT
jgi:hypothetical protein